MEWKIVPNHPINQILGDPNQGIAARSSLKNICNNLAFLSQIKPKNIEEVKRDEYWIMAMQEELNQYERNKVWTLVPRPLDHTIIGP